MMSSDETGKNDGVVANDDNASYKGHEDMANCTSNGRVAYFPDYGDRQEEFNQLWDEVCIDFKIPDKHQESSTSTQALDSNLKKKAVDPSVGKTSQTAGSTDKGENECTREDDDRYKTQISEEDKWLKKKKDIAPSITRNVLSYDQKIAIQNLIWKQPAGTTIKEFHTKPNQLARLLCQNLLCGRNFIWYLESLNKDQGSSHSLCLSVTPPETFKEEMEHRKNKASLKQLVCIANVGFHNKDHTNAYFYSSDKGGSHWVLITIDFGGRNIPVLNYCCSKGWAPPSNLLSHMSKYTETLGFPLKEDNVHVIIMHTVSGKEHKCVEECRNYPFQTCNHVCGVVALIAAIIAVLDKTLFEELTGVNTCSKLLIHEPSKNADNLREVLLRWLVDRKIDIDFIK